MKVIQYIRVNHYFRNIAFVSSVLLFILVTLLCLPISSAEQDTLAVTNQGDSITINFTNNTASVDLSVNNADGTFATSSTEDKAAFSISTDNASGYTLSISSNDDTGELTSGTSSFTSIDSAISSTTFDNSSYNGKWGYLPSKYNSTDNTNYLPSPTTDISILDITSSANATANNYTIALGARTDYSNAVGNYSKTFTLTSIANIIPESCNNSKLCIEYDANGLYYVNPNTTIDRVNYNSTTTQEEMTKYSHTSNVSDEGVASGAYANNLDTTDTVTIPGATTMEVTIYYDTQSTSYDWVSVYQSPFTITDTNDSSVSTVTGNLSGKLAGRKSGRTTNYSTWYSKTYTVTGDTVKFHFKSNASTAYYGYYAVVTSPTVYERSVYSGSYIAPTASSAQTFRGWSTTQVAGGTGHESDVEYLDETAILASIPGGVGETKTLYAVWQQAYPITVTKDDNVSSVTILDSSGNTVSTITESSQTVSLSSGDTYTINPTYNTRYAPNAFEKTSGEGTFTMNSGYKGTLVIGAGPATISITSQYVDTPMQNYSCSNIANVGNTKYVYDTRDNEVYLVGKLADNKCWMLDNLRFDIVAHKDDISSVNTNITTNSATLTSLKTGNRSAGDQYATAGVDYWTSNYSYSTPLIAIKNPSDDKWNPNTTTTSYGPSSGKIGVYYNYCAASAGSYCYDNNAAPTGTNATQDICPAGWRMPTGGSSGEYKALYTAYSSNVTNFRNALSTPLSGDFNNGSASSQGSLGRFWSSTWFGGNMNFLGVQSSNVSPSGDIRRYYGNSVRCLLMPKNTYTLNYDKNTTDTVPNMPSSQSTTIQNDTINYFTLPTDNIPSRSGYTFAGWGTSSDQAEPTYKYNNGTFTPSEATVYANDNPETLYAIWQAPREITFNIDSNVSSVQILDPSGNAVSTVTTTGTNVNLTEPLTYTIKPTHTTNYTTDAITKTSGVGTLNGEEFTVGAGTATITITSREIPILYNEIAALSKGKNTDSNSHFSWTEITTPTTTSPATDTSTSGVFEWDGMTAGNGIDSNGGTQKIYFYRGILETNPGTYGSNGSANAYPNYVKLANNTCWRIVRTTSTGGVKMMYNGMWNSGTSTCANTTTSAQLTTSPFNNASATVANVPYTGLQYQNIHTVGYTYSNLAAGTTAATPISTIFGSTGNDTTTNTKSSIIKQYLESWYGSNMTAYTDKLEGDAGYCNDRTLNTGTSWTTPLTDSDTIIPYGTASQAVTEYYFGSYPRNRNQSTFSPTLACPRGKVDLYSYTNNAGNGNGQLTYPVALLTADEASLAGNGYDNSYSAYDTNSYLRSGSLFWLLSPGRRNSDGSADGFSVGSNGYLGNGIVSSTRGVRPVISLAPGTHVLGSGTATDPWVVQ